MTIDLEWKPEHGPGQNNPVSLMQLSSATVCVLLHTSSMGFTLPAAVKCECLWVYACVSVVCVCVSVCAAAHQLHGLHTASSRQVRVFVGLCVCECGVCVCLCVCVCVLLHTSSMGFTLPAAVKCVCLLVYACVSVVCVC